MTGFDRSETVGHCRRVCALTQRMGIAMTLGEDAKRALSIAASVHQFCGPGFCEGYLSGIFAHDSSLIAAMPVDNGILTIAEKILICLRQPGAYPGRDIAVAADILHACNLLDEAVESGVFEGQTPAEAITRFHEENADYLVQETRSVLRRVTSGTPFALSRATFPVLPKAAAKLMRTSDETSPREFEQIASLDPVLAGRLLEIANSARFGPEQPIMRLAEAAARVGVPMARKILYGACFGRLFASKSLQSIWLRSQTVAALASTAAQLADQDAEIAYAAGLLHDIGRIVFEAADASTRIVAAEWVEHGFPPTYAEALTWATDHAGAGAELLRGWGLPETIVHAVENHHQPERTGSPLASLLFLAEQWYGEKSPQPEPSDLFARMRRDYAARLTGIPSEYPANPGSDFEVLCPAS